MNPVEIVRDGKNKIYYQSTADKDGYFSILTNNLPPTSYSVVLKTPTGSVAERVTTSVFTARNASYLSSNKINLMKDKITVKEYGEKVTVPSGDNFSQEKKGGMTSSNKKMLPVLLVLLLLLGVVLITGVFLFLSAKKKG